MGLMALAVSHGANAAVTGFRLPPSDSATPARPEAEGPAAEDVPRSSPTPVRPAATSPAAPAAAPTATPVIQALPPRIEPAPVAIPQADPQTTRPMRQPAPSATAPAQEAITESRAASANDEPITSPAIEPAAPLQPARSPAAGEVTAPDDANDAGNGWLVALVLLLAAGGGAIFWWRRKGGLAAAPAPAVIEKPRLAPVPPPRPESSPDMDASPQPREPAPAPAPAPEALRVTLEPRKLSLTLMNAALSYQLEIGNTGTEPLSDVAIHADMIAAHASLSRDQQLSGPAADTPPLHQLERLEPGETRIISGEFRLPFPSIVPIRQGSAALLLPLARFRISAPGTETISRVFVVGQAAEQAGGALVPFRLDQGPRIYPHLAQRAFV